jgi:DNA-3-methyladenine glycosylase I
MFHPSDCTHECNAWAIDDPLMLAYHDQRWCVPVHDDRELFAMLALEGMQAGLTWSLIIRREAQIRAAFDDFDIARVAAYGQEDLDRLLIAPGVIHNKLKIKAVVKNAQAVQKLLAQGDFASFDDYVWHFTDRRRLVHHLTCLEETPAQNDLSVTVSKDLKKRGFSFVGPVIIYSWLQGVGVIDDHLEACPHKNFSEQA